MNVGTRNIYKRKKKSQAKHTICKLVDQMPIVYIQDTKRTTIVNVLNCKTVVF